MKKEINSDDNKIMHHDHNKHHKVKAKHPNSHYLSILIILVLLLIVGIILLYIFMLNKPEFSFLPDSNYTTSNRLGFRGITGTSSAG
jgi:hypothetical protein